MTKHLEQTYSMGAITINFSANVIKEVLLEDFNEFLVEEGQINLTNLNKEEIKIEVLEHDFIYFDEESDEDGEVAVGSMTVHFTSDVGAEELQEEWNEDMVAIGTVSLMEVRGVETVLTIHSHEFTYFDEESYDAA